MNPRASSWRTALAATMLLLLGGAAVWRFARASKGTPPEQRAAGETAASEATGPQIPEENEAEPLAVKTTARGASSMEGAAGGSSPTDPESELRRDPEALLKRVRDARPKNQAEAQQLKVLEVRALVRLDRIGEARDRTGDYYARWPQGPDIGLLQGLTGLHPTPSP